MTDIEEHFPWRAERDRLNLLRSLCWNAIVSKHGLKPGREGVGERNETRDAQ